MAQPKTNSFTIYELTDEEKLNGSVLTFVQKMVLQNIISGIAEQLLTLTFDPNNPGDFAQQQAYLRGQLEVLQTTLIRSDESELVLKRLANLSAQA